MQWCYLSTSMQLLLPPLSVGTVVTVVTIVTVVPEVPVVIVTTKNLVLKNLTNKKNDFLKYFFTTKLLSQKNWFHQKKCHKKIYSH